MIKIVICEDEEIYAKHIGKIVEQTVENAEITYYGDGEKLCDDAAEKFDIYLLDIEMPNSNGIETARKIRGQYKKAIIIFLTNYEKYVYDGYEVNALRYIPKKFADEKLRPALECAVDEYKRNSGIIFVVGEEGRHRRVEINSIISVEKELRNVVYYTEENDVIRTKDTLKNAYNNLSAKGNFVVVNRAVIINTDHIYDMDKTKITMDDGREFYISREKTKAVRQKILELLGE